MRSTRDYEDILKKFSEMEHLCSYKEIERSIFDIAGYPHYENVVSNILAFFFDSNEEHGLSNLWLRSLLECYKEKNSYVELNPESVFTDDIVEREVFTDDKKRIDLLITTDNRSNCMIAIENKIWASPYNPWKSYSKHLEKEEFQNITNKYKILLSVKPEKEQDCNFVNITYSELLDRIKVNMGLYLFNANEKWIIITKEFINSIYNLAGGNNEMDSEWNDFLVKNSEVLGDFYEQYTNDIKIKIAKMDEYCNCLKEKLKDEEISLLCEPWVYPKQARDSNRTSYVSIVVDIPYSTDINLVYEPFFYKYPDKREKDKKLGKLYLAVWNRASNKDISSYVKEKLVKEFPNAKICGINNQGWGKYVIIHEFDFAKLSSDDFVETSIKIIKSIHPNYGNL